MMGDDGLALLVGSCGGDDELTGAGKLRMRKYDNLDGPAGWAFCFLSGLSEWVLAREHRQAIALQH